MTDDAGARLDEIISRFDTAMLVTVSLEGQPRARPMAIVEHRAGGRLSFATYVDDEKNEEMLRVRDVAVTMQGDGRYLSLSGKAQLEQSPHPAPVLPPAVKAWFPDGADDPRFMLIVVDPDYAEFWDHGGLRRLRVIWEAGKALVRGDSMSEDAIGGHVKLHSPTDDAGVTPPAGVLGEGLRHGFGLGEYEVDPAKGTVTRDGHRTQLSAPAMDFLVVLATSPGDVIEERQMKDRLGIPSGRQLAGCLTELQVALGDSLREPRYVRKVGESGFQLLVPVHIDVAPVPTSEQILE